MRQARFPSMVSLSLVSEYEASRKVREGVQPTERLIHGYPIRIYAARTLVSFHFKGLSCTPCIASICTDRPVTVVRHSEKERVDFLNIQFTIGEILLFGVRSDDFTNIKIIGQIFNHDCSRHSIESGHSRIMGAVFSSP